MSEPNYMTLECGPSSGGQDRYWIKDVSTGAIVASGVTAEYALLMVMATNEQFGNPELLKESYE